MATVTRVPRMPSDLAAARLRAGFTQEALAEAVGVNRVHLAKLETHRHAPNVSLALRLADALGESVEELFGWARDFQ